jgi:hypothetical protein
MWHRADLVWTDVSEEHIASIFTVYKSASEEPAWASGSRQGCSYLSRVMVAESLDSMFCALLLEAFNGIFYPKWRYTLSELMER